MTVTVSFRLSVKMKSTDRMITRSHWQSWMLLTGLDERRVSELHCRKKLSWNHHFVALKILHGMAISVFNRFQQYLGRSPRQVKILW